MSEQDVKLLEPGGFGLSPMAVNAATLLHRVMTMEPGEDFSFALTEVGGLHVVARYYSPDRPNDDDRTWDLFYVDRNAEGNLHGALQAVMQIVIAETVLVYNHEHSTVLMEAATLDHYRLGAANRITWDDYHDRKRDCDPRARKIHEESWPKTSESFNEDQIRRNDERESAYLASKKRS